MSLEQLLNKRQDIWRGRAASPSTPRGVPTGFASLDALLPWRGWPPGALIEILEEQSAGLIAKHSEEESLA